MLPNRNTAEEGTSIRRLADSQIGVKGLRLHEKIAKQYFYCYLFGSDLDSFESFSEKEENRKEYKYANDREDDDGESDSFGEFQ